MKKLIVILVLICFSMPESTYAQLAGSGCFTVATPAVNATLRVEIASSGKVLTLLTFPAVTQKISRIEYILADVNMSSIAVTPITPCSKNLTGNFRATDPALPLSGLSPEFSSMTPDTYHELNRVTYSSSTPVSISGTVSKNFILPMISTNCDGKLELVLLAIIYYENCGICFAQASASRVFRRAIN